MLQLPHYQSKLLALREALEADPAVHLIGRSFVGMSPRRELFDEIEKSFRDRVVSPPISELAFGGLAIGAAIAGLKPIVDFSVSSFIFEAWPQVVNEAANALYMSGGQTSVPIVFHMLQGGTGPQHYHSPQAMLWNCPGLEIVLPSSPRDVRGLLKTAVMTNNPTVFIDHSNLLEIEGPVPEIDTGIPFGRADIRRKGDDVTLVATSFMVHRSLRVANALSREGIQVEVVDPRTLVPFDLETIMISIEKTRRVIVIDECHRSCGVAAEIMARITEAGFDRLKAPMRRVSTLDAPIPYSSSLEQVVIPSEQRILDAVHSILR
jgi:pyruvate/2-oxoglutarate/acetoin dehydrogenase E1 component